MSFRYRAWSVGKHQQAAKTEIEKLKLEELSTEQLLKEAIKILLTIRDDSKQKQKIEVGWVGANTNGHYQVKLFFFCLIIIYFLIICYSFVKFLMINFLIFI